ncbi:MAG: pilus assembly protein PilA, partial [Bdellovibrio sp.]
APAAAVAGTNTFVAMSVANLTTTAPDTWQIDDTKNLQNTTDGTL